MSFRTDAEQDEIKALFLPRCVKLAGAEAADEDLIEYVAAAVVELLTDHAEAGGGGSGDELLETANETVGPYLTSFLDEDQASAVVREGRRHVQPAAAPAAAAAAATRPYLPRHRCSRRRKKQRPLRTSRNGSLQASLRLTRPRRRQQ